MYKDILAEIISRLESIEDLTVEFRTRDLDAKLPVAMISPSRFNKTSDKARKVFKGDFDIIITLFSEDYNDLLTLIERIEKVVIGDKELEKTLKIDYRGFKLAPTENPTNSIEPAEMVFSISLIRNL